MSANAPAICPRREQGDHVSVDAMIAGNVQDRRSQQTRDSVFRAFLQLVFDRRYDKISTTDLIAEAGIGRSTFYEHFSGKDDVLLAVVDPILLPLANAASGRVGQAALRTMLQHLWERRALGRVIFDSTVRPKLLQKLAAMIAARLETDWSDPVPPALPAMAAAAGQLAMLRMWVAGEVSCSADDLARRLIIMRISSFGGQVSQ